jgi:hypothetical protein
MTTPYLTRLEEPQVAPYRAVDMAQGLYTALAQFLAPLLIELDAPIDKRLVRTFLHTVTIILTFRDRVNGLLLSEMGSYLDTPDKAQAGTKLLSRLLHGAKWSVKLIRDYLWQRASQQLSIWNDAGLDALALWDERVWEKPESFAPQEYGPVRSSKATRLTHIKKGYYTPPRGPIVVPGLHWLAVILVERDWQQTSRACIERKSYMLRNGVSSLTDLNAMLYRICGGCMVFGREGNDFSSSYCHLYTGERNHPCPKPIRSRIG